MSKEVKVIFEPSGRAVYVLPGTVMLEAAARAGFIIHSPCGGAGTCGKCVVRIRAGQCPPQPSETAALGDARVAEGFRMACQARIMTALTVEIPDTSLFQAQQQILTADAGGPVQVQPRIRKRYVELSPPTQHDTASDLDRLRAAVGPFQAHIAAVRELPAALRAAGFKITAVLVDDELIAVESGDTTAECFGIAFDIGSTTLVGTLVNLATGADVAVAARVNPQTSFGDDVVSRIQRCRTGDKGLAQLQTAVLEGVNRIIDELLRKAAVDRQRIYEIVFSGNTTMQEILCGIDPSALGELPFVPAFREALECHAADLHLHVNPVAKVYVFPQIGGFVGGDTVAGIVATRLDRSTAPALLVDIGTNGEIVLFAGGTLWATSVAAGPAFEGARITNGMRAASGAIEKVLLDGDVNVIGNTKPAGLCGTGLIDVAAELLRTGILDPTGRLLPAAEVPASVPAALKARLVEHGHEVDFLLVSAGESATRQPLFLYQKDIRELQLANGAIRAGINILLRTAGLEASDLDSVLLAGAFGNFIRRNHARRIGMLPPIPCSRIRFVGNTASFGAKRALLATTEKAYAARIMQDVRHVDLSLDPEFQMEFAAAMLLPGPELDDCQE
jgi:uncharacterized 2Fe-2S/4Fe-4S cluster protein (DUF4445 family)